MTDAFLLDPELQMMTLDESWSLLEGAEICVLDLERNTVENPLWQQLLRVVHNIKGAGAAVGFTPLSTLAHRLEDLLALLRNKKIPMAPHVTNCILEAL